MIVSLTQTLLFTPMTLLRSPRRSPQGRRKVTKVQVALQKDRIRIVTNDVVLYDSDICCLCLICIWSPVNCVPFLEAVVSVQCGGVHKFAIDFLFTANYFLRFLKHKNNVLFREIELSNRAYQFPLYFSSSITEKVFNCSILIKTIIIIESLKDLKLTNFSKIFSNLLLFYYIHLTNI